MVLSSKSRASASGVVQSAGEPEHTTPMSGFTENAFLKKLNELNNSTHSILTVSLWLIHHRKHYQTVVKIWFKEFLKAKPDRKLTFMYLANDVIQNSRKKGPEYGKEYGLVMKKAFEHVTSIGCDEKVKKTLGRLLHIWGERGVYDNNQITNFEQALLMPAAEPPAKKPKKDNQAKSPPVQRDRKKSELDLMTVEVDGALETHVTLSPRTPANDPPEPEELIKAIQELEGCTASADAPVRQRIAQLPLEVSEVATVAQLDDRGKAQKLSEEVNEAVTLLKEYNGRLETEVELRKRVSTMIRDYLHGQKELMTQAQTTLEEYQDKLQKVFAVRNELRTHIQNLPDLSRLPNVTRGLSPLPSAGDLFKIQN